MLRKPVILQFVKQVVELSLLPLVYLQGLFVEGLCLYI